MSSLIILGNTNLFTFVNSIIAANSVSIEKFKKPLKNIFVIHSSDSQRALSQQLDWIEYLEKNNISSEILTQRTIDIDFTKASIERFVDFIEFIVNGVLASDPDLIVDLTNGTAVHKNLLSTAAYVLELGYQYILDIVKVRKAAEELGIPTKDLRYLPLEVLKVSYVSVPEATQLDGIAYLNLTEIIRYREIIKKHTNKYEQVDRIAADKRFFEGNLSHSIRLKLLGDKNQDNAVYRIAASSVAVSVEDLLSILIDKFISRSHQDSRSTFGNKLRLIEAHLRKMGLKDFDYDFLHNFNEFVRYLRNSSTHKSMKLLDIEKIKADVSTKLTFPFIEFYNDIVYPILEQGRLPEPTKRIRRISFRDINPDDVFYFGLDGDNTGLILEDLFLSANDEGIFQKMSESISQAINEIVVLIKEKFLKGEIIFFAGDDILFKACFDETQLQALQRKYHSTTSGLTCSIGFGKSFQEVYLALKLAKTAHDKNEIVGIEII